MVGNAGKYRKIKGFGEFIKRVRTRFDTYFEKNGNFQEQKEELFTLSTKRAGKSLFMRLSSSFLKLEWIKEGDLITKNILTCFITRGNVCDVITMSYSVIFKWSNIWRKPHKMGIFVRYKLRYKIAEIDLKNA